MNNNYNLDTIQKLKFFDAVRKAPGMYIGSKDADGLHHLAKEIISNSIDEYLNGSCDAIDVVLCKDGSLKITDNGRGIPIGKKNTGKTALELCFTEEHAGGKFLNATGESGYNSAGGMHGLGTKCVNALSDKMMVRTTRDGQTEYIEFINGELKTHTTEKCSDKYHGVEVQFYPSAKYLEEINFNADRLKTLLKEFSFLCKGLTFTFIDEKNNKTESYISKNGLYDYIDYLNKDGNYLCKPLYFEEEEGTFKVEVAFGYNFNYSPNIKLYTNNIPQIKGTHLTGFKTAFTSTLNQFARDKKWLKEKDENLAGSDFEEGQLLVINFKMIDPVFKGQNKEELSSSEGRTYVQKFSAEALKRIFSANEKDIKAIVDKALLARKAREAAKKARDAARDNDKKKKEKLIIRDTKLADCSSSDRTICEIFLTEGDSASGNLKIARNKKTQAVMPLRGKVLNVSKATLDKIKGNAEIVNIIDSLGLEIDIKTLKLTYNPITLRYDKIILMADADDDGYHIQSLLLTLFWTFCRDLILDGHVYVGVPPLYTITEGKDKISYCKDDAELEAYKRTHAGKKYVVKHLKGLGEMSAADTDILVNPERRTLYQVTVDNIDTCTRLFDDLMGNGTVARKLFIENYKEN